MKDKVCRNCVYWDAIDRKKTIGQCTLKPEKSIFTGTAMQKMTPAQYPCDEYTEDVR